MHIIFTEKVSARKENLLYPLKKTENVKHAGYKRVTMHLIMSCGSVICILFAP